jgi:succinyl-diaminopimelate desuccinylase
MTVEDASGTARRRPRIAPGAALALTQALIRRASVTPKDAGCQARLAERGQRIDWCVLGEPSSQQHLGDTVRVGRRGSLTGRLRVGGLQGHVAYPEKARNPIHAAAPALAELAATRWDDGNADFPPTSFQIAGIEGGTGAANVIPGHLDVLFNFRHSTQSTVEALQARVRDVLARHAIDDFELTWDEPPSQPFVSQGHTLRRAVVEAVQAHAGLTPQMNTGGGTSDGRFIAPHGVEVVELGPVNASIHQVNEHVLVEDIERLAAIYLHIIERLLDPVAPSRDEAPGQARPTAGG